MNLMQCQTPVTPIRVAMNVLMSEDAWMGKRRQCRVDVISCEESRPGIDKLRPPPPRLLYFMLNPASRTP